MGLNEESEVDAGNSRKTHDRVTGTVNALDSKT